MHERVYHKRKVVLNRKGSAVAAAIKEAPASIGMPALLIIRI